MAAAGQRPRRARSIRIHQHQLRAVAGAVLGVDPCGDVDDAPSVRADLRVGHEPQPIQVLGCHWPAMFTTRHSSEGTLGSVRFAAVGLATALAYGVWVAWVPLLPRNLSVPLLDLGKIT